MTPSPRYLYPSMAHREALASLSYGFENNLGFATLIAEPGMGKTTLLFQLLKLSHATRTAFVFETQCNSQSLLRYLLTELGHEAQTSDLVELHQSFKQLLLREHRNGRRVLLIIDEAQNLDGSVLETIRLLSDFETSDSKMLHIILSGQPVLAEKLARPELKQLLQRIPILNFLRPLNTLDVKAYVRHRLRIAGYASSDLFGNGALECIARQSRGVPREINRICFNAMSLGFAAGAKHIETCLVEQAVADLDLNTLVEGMKKPGDELASRVEESQMPPQSQASNAGWGLSITNGLSAPKSEAVPQPTTREWPMQRLPLSSTTPVNHAGWERSTTAPQSPTYFSRWRAQARKVRSISMLLILLAVCGLAPFYPVRPINTGTVNADSTAPAQAAEPIVQRPHDVVPRAVARTKSAMSISIRRRPRIRAKATAQSFSTVTKDGLQISWSSDSSGEAQPPITPATGTLQGLNEQTKLPDNGAVQKR